MTRDAQIREAINIALSTYHKGCGFTLEQWFSAKELYRKHKKEMLDKVKFKPWVGFPR